MAAAHTRRPPEERRPQLVQAALDVLAETGLAHFTLARVAKRAKVQSSLLIHYFGSREALLREVLDAVQDHYREVFTSAIAGKSPRGFLPVLVGLMFDPPPHVRRYAHAFTDAIAAAYAEDAEMKAYIRKVYEGFDTYLVRVLSAAFPDAHEGAIRYASYTLLCLSEAHRSFLVLGFDAHERGEQVRRISNAILAVLGQYGSDPQATFQLAL